MATWTGDNIAIAPVAGSKTQFSFSATIKRDGIAVESYVESVGIPPQGQLLEFVQMRVKQRVLILSAADAVDASTPVPAVDDKPIPPADQTEQEKARAEFVRNVQLYRGMRGAVNLGLMGDNAKVKVELFSALQVAVDANPDYVELLGGFAV